MSLLRRSKFDLPAMHSGIEAWLEREREQLPLWAPVMLGAGACAWFALPTQLHWIAWLIFWLGLALGLAALGLAGRLGRSLVTFCLLMAAGLILVWGKALMVGKPPLARPAMVVVEGRLVSLQPLAARELVRMQVAPIGRADLPPLIQVNARPPDVPPGLAEGAVVRFRARLMPPAGAALPGAYDFSRTAYFAGIGASGRILGAVEIVHPAASGPGLRDRLAAHVASSLPGPEGAIAVTLATGDQSAIAADDAEAMRRSGLAHLLSISGLHVSALIGAVILLTRRLLALSPRLALALPVPLLAAVCGAAAGIGYTLLTGAQVPTVRSCIAALLVIGGLALGREAISLRLIAFGALFVLCFWPETVIGPSFQMSFAAVTAIVALYELPVAKAFVEPREESRWRRLGRHLLAALVTGLVVEIVLAPIAMAHFHRAGLLGAIANLVAIPLTSFVVMPGEALALLLDPVGLGTPLWWLVGAALRLLLLVANKVAEQPFATVDAAMTANGLFVVTMLGLLWAMLWRGRPRWLGLPVAAIGMAAMLVAPGGDILVTSDGRHVALRLADGRLALLRERAGDYVRTTFAEIGAYEGEFSAFVDSSAARCSADLCEAVATSPQGRQASLLATRSSLLVPTREMVAACARVDIVVSDRRLPRSCVPRWAKLDRPALEAAGGAIVLLGEGRIVTGHRPDDAHPWFVRQDAAPRRPGQL